MTAGYDVDEFDPIAFGLSLSVLPHNHILVTAVRCALDVIDGRRDHLREQQDVMVQASHAISAARDWRSTANNLVPFHELQRRRAERGQGR
jgi:hypothetical protein